MESDQEQRTSRWRAYPWILLAALCDVFVPRIIARALRRWFSPESGKRNKRVLPLINCGINEGMKTEQKGKEQLAAWMIDNSFATGHGDTTADLLKELNCLLKELTGQVSSKPISLKKCALAYCRASEEWNMNYFRDENPHPHGIEMAKAVLDAAGGSFLCDIGRSERHA